MYIPVRYETGNIFQVAELCRDLNCIPYFT